MDVVTRYVENAAARNLHQRRWASLPMAEWAQTRPTLT